MIGSFEYDNMNYEGKRDKDIAGEPHLANMTRKAIEILKKNEKGFFLLVEGEFLSNLKQRTVVNYL